MLDKKGKKMPMVSKTGKKTQSRYPILAKIDKYVRSHDSKAFISSIFQNKVSKMWLKDRKKEEEKKDLEKERAKEAMKNHLIGLDYELSEEAREISEKYKFEFFEPEEVEQQKYKNVRKFEYIESAIVKLFLN